MLICPLNNNICFHAQRLKTVKKSKSKSQPNTNTCAFASGVSPNVKHIKPNVHSIETLYQT